MDAGHIEFVSDDAPAHDGGDDVLDVGLPRRQLPRPLWVAVALLVVGAGVLWLVVGRSATPSARTAAIPLSPVVTAPSASIVTPQPSGPTFRQLAGIPCRDPGVCVVSAAVPRDVRRVVQQYLPQAQGTSVHSATREGATAGDAVLLGRTLEAHLGSSTLLISLRVYLRPSVGPIPAITATPPGLSSAFLHVETPSFVIDVQWIAPGETIVPMTHLRSLATDPRLEALG